MKQEDKDILLKYLCMALPYGLKILHEGWNYEWDDELSTVERVVGIDENFIYTKVIDTHNGEEYRDDKWPVDTFDDKPYLRPMSSMTDDEKRQYGELCDEDIRQLTYVQIVHPGLKYKTSCYRSIVWLLEHHFDFMDLIPKGLAIEVTNENNPYESNM